MTPTPQDIDWIVREVVRRLRDVSAGAHAGSEAAGTDENTPRPVTSSGNGTMGLRARRSPTHADGLGSPSYKTSGSNPLRHTNDRVEDQSGLVIYEPLVTLATVQGRLSGVRHVVLAPGAVVTPSVKDELRRRGVTVVFENRSLGRTLPSVELAVAVAETRFNPQPLVQAIDTDVSVAAFDSGRSLLVATRCLAAEVTERGRLGLLFTENPTAAVCLLNRFPGVRAAMSCDPDTTRRAVGGIGVNVLVVDPAGESEEKLAATLRAFVEAGPRECPEAYRSVLEL